VQYATFTQLRLNPITGRFEDVQCGFEESDTVHLGSERLYFLRGRDGRKVFYAFDGVSQYKRAEIEARAQAVRDLGCPCARRIHIMACS
jgi:hypothetical protein